MADNINAYCSVCGEGYYMCLSCKDTINSAPWKVQTDTAEHYKVHQVVRGYNTGVYTKEEAAERLAKVDLSDKDKFVDAVRKCVDDIMSVEQKPARQKFKPRYERNAEKVVKTEGVAHDGVQVNVKDDAKVMPAI